MANPNCPPTVLPKPPPNPSAAKGFGPLAPAPKLDWRLVPKKQRHLLKPKFIGVEGNSRLKLAKPLTRKARRMIAKKTRKLMKRRDEIDAQLIEESDRAIADLRAGDWLPRQQLLDQHFHLERREKRHIRRRTLALQERESLYRWDPTTDRAIDLDLIRTLLWQFKRHLGPYISHYQHINEGEVDDNGSSSEDEEDKGGREDLVERGGDSDDDKSASKEETGIDQSEESDEGSSSSEESSDKNSSMGETGEELSSGSLAAAATKENSADHAKGERKRALENDGVAETADKSETKAEEKDAPKKTARTSVVSEIDVHDGKDDQEKKIEKAIKTGSQELIDVGDDQPKNDDRPHKKAKVVKTTESKTLSPSNAEIPKPLQQDTVPEKPTDSAQKINKKNAKTIGQTESIQGKATSSKACNIKNARQRSNDEIPRPPTEWRKKRMWEITYQPLDYNDMVFHRASKRRRTRPVDEAIMTGAGEGFPEDFVDTRRKCKKHITKPMAPPPGYVPSPEKPKPKSKQQAKNDSKSLDPAAEKSGVLDSTIARLDETEQETGKPLTFEEKRPNGSNPDVTEEEIMHNEKRSQQVIAKRERGMDAAALKIAKDGAGMSRASKQFSQKFGKLRSGQDKRNQRFVSKGSVQTIGKRDRAQFDTIRRAQYNAISTYSSVPQARDHHDRSEMAKTTDHATFALSNVENDPFLDTPGTPTHNTIRNGVFTPSTPPKFSPLWTTPGSPTPVKNESPSL